MKRILLILSLAFAFNPVLAAVADQHGAKGMECASCHGPEKPSSANISEEICIKCHGETPNGKPFKFEGHEVKNIHAGHFDAYECMKCHKGHQPSVLACSECHKGGADIKVP